MEKRGLIIKQFRGNECIIAISGLAISALEGKKEKKKKKKGRVSTPRPFSSRSRYRVSENSFFSSRESTTIVEREWCNCRVSVMADILSEN